MRLRPAIRALLLAALALVGTACFETDARTAVGADGRAASRVVVELDLGRLEDLFGGFAEAFGELEPDIPDQLRIDDAPEPPSMIDEARADLEQVEQDLEDLYRQRPELRDRLRMRVEIDGDIVRTEILALTEDIEDLATFLSGVIGDENLDTEGLFGVPEGFLADSTDEVGGGSGIFDEVTTSFDGGRFELRASSAGDGFGDDLPLEGLGGLTPKVSLLVQAPGDIVETNGRRSGRTVTWDLQPGDAVVLVSEIDPSVRVTSLDDVPDGAGSSDFPVGLVVVLVVLALLAVGAFLFFRNGTGPSSVETGTSTP